MAATESLDGFPEALTAGAHCDHLHGEVEAGEFAEDGEVVVGPGEPSVEEDREDVAIEAEFGGHVVGLALVAGLGAVERGAQEEAALEDAVFGHADGAGGGADLVGGTNKAIGPRVNPVAAQAVAAREFATIRDATRAAERERSAGEVKKTVVGVRVDADDPVGLPLGDQVDKRVASENLGAAAVERGELQVVEVNVVQARAPALDRVIDADAEMVERVGVFQHLMNTDFD